MIIKSSSSKSIFESKVFSSGMSILGVGIMVVAAGSPNITGWTSIGMFILGWVVFLAFRDG